ncbi:hypothetical protein L1887_10247 [Cichorium endivia]|nr:hypothetical protein L1887_10247 [Cichorium endivia]
MWSVPSPSTPYLVAAINSSSFVDPNSFSKAGRKINVGDCALFKLPNGSPPFVGIIRRLTVDKEKNLTLTVNWFYRPAEVKLSKGALLEAAPNEVFYSFHKDEISATSLLHPCKVAFLRKGVDLPSGVSSFVCRRVYDIENKCLWWLTDQNYIIKQEEVDELLDKTQAEMHGGRSPKPLNSPNGTTQLKPTSDKSKKREHIVQSPDSVKREEADAGQVRPEHVLKSELAKITDKGGLVDYEGVEKLIQLMQPESADRKVDLASRVILADVISVTERFECLGRFVQRRGLLIIDEWLQEVHKGKIGDGSPKGSDKDKSVEEFLFALLRALDRLPVNLHALQTCNVGKSVNHLRSHKNSEIQKKARSLVDTWKKRVEAEMNIIETRSGARRGGSWPNKSMMPEVKVSPSNPQLRSQQGKPNSGDAIVKSPESSSPTKPPPPLPVSSDVPPVTLKEEKSRSCSPNNSQSCSSDHGKTGASDASMSKISTGVSHSRKSSNAVTVTPGGQKEGVIDNMNNSQRLIVRLPNTVRSPSTDLSQVKEGVIGSEEKFTEASVTSASDATLKPGKSYENSYSSVNALVESCAKFSEANVSAPAGDDVGMNLLASVAAGEMSRSDVSPSCSPENKPPLPEDACSEDNSNSRQSVKDGCQSEDNLKVTNGHARLAENCNAVPVHVSPEVGPAVLVSDVASSEKVEETQVNDESGSRSSSDKHEDEKKPGQKEDDVDSEMLASSCGRVSVEQKAEQSDDKANTDPDSSVLLEASENADTNEARNQEGGGSGSGPPDSTSAPVSETPVKLDFDLNEVVPSDDTERHCSLPYSITVTAAAKGPFLSSENLLKGKKTEVGWKGSAATSAFRPAEPRKAREFLDFDLNVGVVDDVTQNNVRGGLDLNINASEETPDVGPGPLTVAFGRPNVPQPPPRSFLSSGFDLNGPGVEENGGESVPLSRNGIQFMPNVRMGNMDVGNFHSWFPTSSTYPAIPIPAQSYPMVPSAPSQRMLTPVNSGGPSFNPEIFRGPVLSSSPAVAFPSSMPFQFPGFPFETNFAVNSNTYSAVSFPTIPSQLVGASGVVSAPYRPFMMSLPGGSSNIDGRRWGSHGLDLNAGPGGGADQVVVLAV